jgi:hypothetical protein
MTHGFLCDVAIAGVFHNRDNNEKGVPSDLGTPFPYPR